MAPKMHLPELAYTKALGYRWLRRDDRTDGMLLRGDSRLVEIRHAMHDWRCADCGRLIRKGKKYGFRATQRFRVVPRTIDGMVHRQSGLYEREGWTEHYCANCIQQTPISRRHRTLPKNRRTGSTYTSPPEIARRR